MQDDKTAVADFISSYAAALNTNVPSPMYVFFTADGIFAPDGYKKLSAHDLRKVRGRSRQTTRFHIDYKIETIAIGNGYAFVDAVAIVQTVNIETAAVVNHISNDFFILQKVDQQWKIYRYIFNNRKQQ